MGFELILGGLWWFRAKMRGSGYSVGDEVCSCYILVKQVPQVLVRLPTHQGDSAHLCVNVWESRNVGNGIVGKQPGMNTLFYVLFRLWIF